MDIRTGMDYEHQISVKFQNYCPTNISCSENITMLTFSTKPYHETEVATMPLTIKLHPFFFFIFLNIELHQLNQHKLNNNYLLSNALMNADFPTLADPCRDDEIEDLENHKCPLRDYAVSNSLT